MQRFQSAYGLGADGVAGPATFSKIYELQDDDCTPIHFTYAELDDGCGGSGFDGGPLSEAATKANALQTMWQLEAMRHALGDQPLVVTSGFRSIPCNNAVGGASNSQHCRPVRRPGRCPPLCTLAKQARNHGFGGIFGPGYPGPTTTRTRTSVRRTCGTPLTVGSSQDLGQCVSGGPIQGTQRPARRAARTSSSRLSPIITVSAD